MRHGSDGWICVKLQSHTLVVDEEMVHVAILGISQVSQVEFVQSREAFVDPDEAPPLGTDEVSEPSINKNSLD